MTHGKKYCEVSKLVDKNKLYPLVEAMDLVKKTACAKFDETIEIVIRLGIDPKQAEQLVRGAVVLPHGTGKTKKILVLAKGEKLKEAETSGADHIGSEEMIEKIAQGFLDFDVIVATPDIMKELSKVAKILGPKGLMPSPKLDTVTFEINKAVSEIKKGKVDFRADSSGVIHSFIGKASFNAQNLVDNAKALLEAVIKLKPPTAKGQYIKGSSIASTMGPGIKIDMQQVMNEITK